MTATIYIDPYTRREILSENVQILELSQKPKIKKNGKLYKRPYSYTITAYEAILLDNWNHGLMRASVKYPDGCHDTEVLVHIDDIKL